MTTSPVPSYLLGTAFIGIGLSSFLQPLSAHTIFGVPAPAPTPAPAPGITASKSPEASTRSPGVSPFVFAKAARDVAIGVLFFAFQLQGDDAAVGTLMVGATAVGVLDGA